MKEVELRTKLAEIAVSKESILAQLSAIHQLESDVEKRMITGLKPVLDIRNNRPLNLENIEKRIKGLAKALFEAFSREKESDASLKEPILISVMDGALPFAAKIQYALSKLGFHCQYATIQVSSYEGTESGSLVISSTLKIPVGGRDVIIVDDVCDTGKTYHALRLLLLQKLGARSVKLMALVDKTQPREYPEANPSYSGFTVSPEEFIAGWGMDFDGLLRSYFNDIGGVDKSTLPNDAETLLLHSKKTLNKRLQDCLTAEDKLNVQLQKCLVPVQPDPFYLKCLVGMAVAGAALTALSILWLNPVMTLMSASLFGTASVVGLYHRGFFSGSAVENPKVVSHEGMSPLGQAS